MNEAHAKIMGCLLAGDEDGALREADASGIGDDVRQMLNDWWGRRDNITHLIVGDAPPWLNPAQRDLQRAMSDLSEECRAAGWDYGTERALWACMVEPMPDGGRRWGHGVVTQEDVARLRALSEACGGWIVWESANNGETWLPIEDWRRRYAAERGEG